MKRLTITTANLEGKDRLPVREYLRWLRRLTRPGLMCLQEYGSGRKSVRVRIVGAVDASAQTWREVGDTGVHRWISFRDVVLGGERVRVVSAHGLHLRSVGRKAQRAYFRALAAWLRSLTERGIRWVLAGDLNRAVAKVARKVRAAGYIGTGVDGILVSPGLRVRRSLVSRIGISNRWTDHPSVTGVVTLVKP